MPDNLNNDDLRSAAVTDVGLTRAHNEDYFLIDEDAGVYIVADGVGGQARGEVASRIACEVALKAYIERRDAVEAFNLAHEEVKKQAALIDDAQGMSTTIVMAKVDGKKLDAAWVGDSRVYRYASNSEKLEQLSTDHTLVQMMVNEGVLSPEEALNHPKKNVITQAIGSPVVDGLEVGRCTVNCEANDIILLCSDGLSDMVPDAEIRKILARDLFIDEKANYLIGAALKGGGRDNVTALLIEISIA